MNRVIAGVGTGGALYVSANHYPCSGPSEY
jgi:hypothetical protein